jgi:hypothetical protein
MARDTQLCTDSQQNNRGHTDGAEPAGCGHRVNGLQEGLVDATTYGAEPTIDCAGVHGLKEGADVSNPGVEKLCHTLLTMCHITRNVKT